MSQPKPVVTPAEYLDRERASDARHQFIDGEVLSRDGANKNHNQICFNLAAELGRQLKGRDCVAYVNDMRVKIERPTSYVYPDLAATCRPPQFDDE